jgi:hypothetical protein
MKKDKILESTKVFCSFDKMVETVDIKPNPKNPNQHPQKQIKLLAKIIKAQGWRAPITISNRSGLVVRGHGRLMAAKQLKLKECPVDFQDYETNEAELADLIADNKIAELAVIDEDKIIDIFKDLEDCVEKKLTGFDKMEFAELLMIPEEEDASPQLATMEYKVLIDCESEKDQGDLIKSLEKIGKKCRPIIL